MYRPILKQLSLKDFCCPLNSFSGIYISISWTLARDNPYIANFFNVGGNIMNCACKYTGIALYETDEK